MPVTTIPAQGNLASQLTERFGPLLTQSSSPSYSAAARAASATASARRATSALAR